MSKINWRPNVIDTKNRVKQTIKSIIWHSKPECVKSSSYYVKKKIDKLLDYFNFILMWWQPLNSRITHCLLFNCKIASNTLSIILIMRFKEIQKIKKGSFCLYVHSSSNIYTLQNHISASEVFRIHKRQMHAFKV